MVFILTFSFNKDKIKKAISYVITEPKEEDALRGHKIPYLCCELLSFDESKISNFFFLTNKELVEEAERAKKEKEEKMKKEQEEEFIPTDNKEEEKKEEEPKEEKVIENPNSIELLDYLLTFLDTKEELNYVLSGYFSKLIITFILRKPDVIIPYIFKNRKEYLDKLVYHSYRKGICDIIEKILNEEKTNISSKSNPDQQQGEDFSPICNEILEKLFKELSSVNANNTEKISYLSSLIEALLEEKAFTSQIESLQNLPELFSNLKINLKETNTFEVKNNYMEILDLVTNIVLSITNKSLSLPEYHIPDDIVEQGHLDYKIQHTPLSQQIFDVLEPILNNFSLATLSEEEEKKKKLPTAFLKELLPLGGFRIKIVEFLSSLFSYFKKIGKDFDKVLIEKKFFENAFDILFKYEWNNLYQNAFFSLLKNYIQNAEFHKDLTVYLFEELNILHIIQDKIVSDDKFTYPSQKSISHGYYPFLIGLSYKLNSVMGGIPLKISKESKEGSMCFPTKSDKLDFIGGGFDGFGFRSGNTEESIGSSSKVKVISDSLTKYASNEWNEFFKTNVSKSVIQYESKLNVKDEVKDSTDETLGFMKNYEANDKEENNKFTEDINLFLENPKSSEKVEEVFTNELNFDDFEFTDDDNAKNPPTEEELEKQNLGELKIDELELESSKYNDSNYWSGDETKAVNQKILDEALRELEIS